MTHRLEISLSLLDTKSTSSSGCESIFDSPVAEREPVIIRVSIRIKFLPIIGNKIGNNIIITISSISYYIMIYFLPIQLYIIIYVGINRWPFRGIN